MKPSAAPVRRTVLGHLSYLWKLLFSCLLPSASTSVCPEWAMSQNPLGRPKGILGSDLVHSETSCPDDSNKCPHPGETHCPEVGSPGPHACLTHDHTPAPSRGPEDPGERVWCRIEFTRFICSLHRAHLRESVGTRIVSQPRVKVWGTSPPPTRPP